MNTRSHKIRVVIGTKYTKPSVLFLVATIPFVAMFYATNNPGWVVLLYPMFAVIGMLFGFILAPIFLRIYKILYGRNLLFAIQERPAPEKSYGTLSGMFPVLMATNFALSLIFNPVIMTNPMFQDYYTQWSGIIFLFFNLGGYFQALAFALFSAAWIIYDSGIVTTNKPGVGNISDPVELNSIGGWFLTFLKGYAGIGVVLSLYQFTFAFLDTYGAEVHFSALFFLFLLPIIISFWVIPAVIMRGATFTMKRNFILNYARKIGIKNEFESNITSPNIGQGYVSED